MSIVGTGTYIDVTSCASFLTCLLRTVISPNFVEE